MSGGGVEFAFCPVSVVDDYGHPVPCRMPATVDRLEVLWVTADTVATATYLLLSCPRHPVQAPTDGRVVLLE